MMRVVSAVAPDDTTVAEVGKGRPRKRRPKVAPVLAPVDWRGVDPADLSNAALYAAAASVG